MRCARILCSKRFASQRASSATNVLVDPYGSAFQGFHRGQVFTPSVPEEIVVALLTEAVPFHQQVAVITPMVEGPVDTTFSQLVQEQFKQVKTVSLQKRQKTEAPPKKTNATSSHLVVEMPLPDVVLPIETFAAASLDAVFFSVNVMASLLSQSPFTFTCCHRVLRPHGVVGIVGQRNLRVVAPDVAVEEFTDFSSHVNEATAAQMRASSDTLLQYDSIEAEHRDLYIPLPHVKRRTFTTQYKLSIEELIGYIRGSPQYKELSKVGGRENDRPGVRRLSTTSCPVDPLQVLEGILVHKLGIDGSIVAEVDTFVVTADRRPHNLRGLVERPSKRNSLEQHRRPNERLGV